MKLFFVIFFCINHFLSIVQPKVLECTEINEKHCFIKNHKEEIASIQLSSLHIKNISIVNCNFGIISTITSSNHSDLLENLKTLETINSTLHTFESDLHCTSLEYIDFSNSNIKNVKGSFNGTENIVKLNLSMNSIEILKSNTFYGLKKLKILDLSKNKVKHIPFDLFDENIVLEQIYLQHNSVRKISHLILNWNQNLIINLSNNDLHELNLVSKEDNQIHYNKKRKIIDIYAANNQLSSVTITNFSISILDLSNNFIENTHFLCEESFQTLNYLNLYRNMIENVECIDQLDHLIKLNLSQNNFKEVDIKKLYHPRDNYFVIFHEKKSFTVKATQLAQMSQFGNISDRKNQSSKDKRVNFKISFLILILLFFL